MNLAELIKMKEKLSNKKIGEGLKFQNGFIQKSARDEDVECAN